MMSLISSRSENTGFLKTVSWQESPAHNTKRGDQI